MCIYIYICTYIACTYIYMYLHRPTQSMMYVHFLVARFQSINWLIIQCKYIKSCAKDQMLQDLILRAPYCDTGFITHPGWLIHFHQISMIRWKCFVPVRNQLWKGILAWLALQYFCMIHRVGRYTCVCMYTILFYRVSMTRTHCNTLRHTATYCNTLQHNATHCNALQHTATKDSKNAVCYWSLSANQPRIPGFICGKDSRELRHFWFFLLQWESKRQREREKERVCVWVCVC